MSDSVQVSPSVSFSNIELMIMGLGCFAVLVLLGVVLWIVAKRGQEELMGSEEIFERQVFEQIKAPPPAPTATRPAPVTAAAPWSPMPAIPPLDVGSPMDGLIARLKSMGLLGGFRETLKLGFPPDGQVYHLVGGGTVLVLPRMESEGLLSHALTVHSMVVAPTAGGEVLVITKLGQRMSVKVEQTERGP
jgi:Na+-transporting methylmalonyl-CoA/oxaloacetate decarboxylase gamma subunit